MTRARALKSVIRARSAKTGERYTTARRHVLKGLAAQPVASPAAASPSASPAPAPTASPAPPEPAIQVTAPVKGAVSDARCLERTGHDLTHWFAVLDRFGAVALGHTAAARHLHAAHGVDGWYAQGITVAYERARGVRAPNQRTSGSYEFSASKIVAADAVRVRAALTEKRRRSRWTAAVDPSLARALDAAFAAGSATRVFVKANGLVRYRFTWDKSAVEIYVEPRADGRSLILVSHTKLPSQDTLDLRRPQWRAALAALAVSLARR